MTDERLSKWLLEEIQDRDEGELRHLPAEKREKAEKDRESLYLFVRAIVDCRQTLNDQTLARLTEKFAHIDPDLTFYLLDNCFTRQLLKGVGGCVERTMKLSALEAESKPSMVTSQYLREAVQTYVFGLAQASVALSRAALEQALKEKMGYQGTRWFGDMGILLDEAEAAGVIDRPVREMARSVYRNANDVLHEKPASLTTAFDVLLSLRGVLQHIYADE